MKASFERPRTTLGILVPGVFLSAQILLVMCVLGQCTADDLGQKLGLSGASNLFVISVFGLSFAFPAGVVLRSFSVNWLDDRSARALKRLPWRREGETYLEEAFPYVKRMGELCRFYYPDDAFRFYKDVWLPALRKSAFRKNPDKPPLPFKFHNFCQVLITSANPACAYEIHATEGWSRYVCGMVYALMASFVLVFIAQVVDFIASHTISPIFIAMLVLYAIGYAVLLPRVRFTRLKEAQTLFAAAYANRALFEPNSVGQKP